MGPYKISCIIDLCRILLEQGEYWNRMSEYTQASPYPVRYSRAGQTSALIGNLGFFIQPVYHAVQLISTDKLVHAVNISKCLSYLMSIYQSCALLSLISLGVPNCHDYIATNVSSHMLLPCLRICLRCSGRDRIGYTYSPSHSSGFEEYF